MFFLSGFLKGDVEAWGHPKILIVRGQAEFRLWPFEKVCLMIGDGRSLMGDGSWMTMALGHDPFLAMARKWPPPFPLKYKMDRNLKNQSSGVLKKFAGGWVTDNGRLLMGDGSWMIMVLAMAYCYGPWPWPEGWPSHSNMK